MKLSFGMSETLVVCGSLLYSSSLALSLSMIILGLISKVCAVALEKAAQDEKIKAAENSVNKFTDTLEQIITEGLSNITGQKNESGTYH